MLKGEVSGWKDVTSGPPMKSVLGLMLFHIFISDFAAKSRHTLVKFDGDTMLQSLLMQRKI